MRHSVGGPLSNVQRLRAIDVSSLVLTALGPFIALMLRHGPRILLAMLILDIPLQLGTHLGYREDVASRGAFGGFTVSVTTLALIGLYLWWLMAFLARTDARSRPSFQTSFPLTLYLVFTAFSCLVAHDVTLSLFELFLLLQMYLVYIYVASSTRTRQDVQFALTFLLIGLVLESIVMAGLSIRGQGFHVAGISGRIDSDLAVAGPSYRIGGTVGSPNNTAAYLSLLLAPTLAFLFTKSKSWYKALAVFAFGLGVIALILTFSRGGWVAFGLSIAGLCWLSWRRGHFSLKVPIATAIVVLLLALPFSGVIFDRLVGDDSGAAHSRVALMHLAFRIIAANPILGVGSNNFPVVMEQYATRELSGEWLYAAHNKYLLIWSEIGIGGLAVFLWFLFATLRRGWQCWKLNDAFLSPLALGFLAALVGHMIQMSVEPFRGRPVTQLVWFIAALVTAMHRMTAAATKSESRVDVR